MKKKLLILSLFLFSYNYTISANTQNSSSIRTIRNFEKNLTNLEDSIFINPYLKTIFKIKKNLISIQKSKLPQLSKSTLELKFKVSLAYIYRELNQIDSSYYCSNEISNILEKYPIIQKNEPLYVATHWSNFGQLFQTSYHYYTRAISCFEEGLRTYKYIKNTQKRIKQKINLLNNLGNVYDVLNKNDIAASCYRQIEKYQLNSLNNNYIIYTSIGWNHIRCKEYSKAITSFKKSLNIVRTRLKNKDTNLSDEDIALGLFDLGMAHSYNSNYADSDKYLDYTINYYRKKHKDKNKYLSLALFQKAQNAYASTNYSTGLTYTQKAIRAIVVEFEEDDFNKNPQLSQIIIDYPTLFHILSFKGKILSQLYKNKLSGKNLDLIVNSYHLAVKLSTMFRKRIEHPADKLVLNQNNTTVFDNAIDAAYRSFYQEPTIKKVNVLLSIIENTKALALSDKISVEKIKLNSNILKFENEERAEEKKNILLKEKIAEIRLDRAKYDSLKSELHKSDIKLASYQKLKFDNMFPKSGRNNLSSNDVNVYEIIANLSPKSVYINYSISNDFQVYVLAINHEKVMFKKLANKPSIKKTIDDFTKSLTKNPTVFSYEGANLSQDLYNYLLKPIEPMLINQNRLIISRDGSLNYLPFETLETGLPKNDKLINHFAISYQYTALSFILRKNKDEYTPNKLLTVAPFSTKQKTPDGKILNALETLPKTRDEQIFKDKDASKQNFINNIEKYNVLNLECHSVADSANFDNSYIIFSPKSEHWQLGYNEILTLELSKCKLLMLASCNSANGRNEAYEGVLSLGYAFYKAGSQSVVAAQWEAHDRSSVFIMSRFYHYINEGEEKDFALQKAKIDFLESSLGKELDHPFFWANLTLTGNINAIESSTSLYLYFLLIIPILVIIVWFLYKKKNKIQLF